jgi:asparagine synthase (glutamine-hydrolysing)
MCGIAATFDLHGGGRAEPWALPLIRHRGPDGEGVLAAPDGNLVLEHCRLAIIDPDNPEAGQPFTDPTGRWTIAYNGEVFNFRELRRELAARGFAFRTDSDTEVVLAGYIAEGERFLERLRGMFAFAVWDRDARQLFLARDQVGVKPLYYAVSDGLLAVCSEVRPLLLHPHLTPRLDPEGVVEFLAFGGNLGETTLVSGVRRLLPGHWLRADEAGVTVRQWWDPIGDSPEPAEDLEADLCDRLDTAVARALVSDVPVALMLSGGIDSSAIAVLAARHVRGADLTAYSVAFGRDDDEVAAAARLAGELGIRHRVVSVTEDDVRAEIDSWLGELDYPTANPTWIASSFIARAAHADGIKVLLSGDGGDELFGGYDRWMKYLAFHDTLWAHTPGALRRVAGTALRPVARGLAGDIARRAASGGELFVTSRPFHDDLLLRSLGPAGRSAALATPPEQRIGTLRQEFDRRLPGGDYLAWMSYATLRTSLVEDYLQRLDKMGMRHSVEGRVPLLDPDLVRFALSLPQRLKVPGRRQKALMRGALADVLPAHVLNRPKQGFCPPIGSWVESVLAARPVPASSLFADGLLERDAVERLRGSRSDSFASWTAAILAEWVDRHVDRASAGAAVAGVVAA